MDKLFSSSIGKKIVMAASGLALIGFVVMHLIGNLLIFAGPEALNSYAEKLRDLGELLWIARMGLIVMVLLHIWSAICVTRENRKARPVAYFNKVNARTTIGARTMAFSGVVLLAYIIFHLLHFTFRVTHPEISNLLDAQGRHDVFSMAVLSFHQIPIVAVYVIAMVFLCLHLSHGISSAFQTLGIANENTLPKFILISKTISLFIFLGYSSIPLACWLGIIKPIH